MSGLLETKPKETMMNEGEKPNMLNDKLPNVQDKSVGDANRTREKGMILSREEHDEDEIIINWDDVVDEQRYWQNAVVGYVLGDKVSYSVMKSFIRQQWSKIAIPELHLHAKGYFLFRFADDLDKEYVRSRTWFLNSKSLIFRDWQPHLSFDEATVERVPTWIQLPELDLEFWGKRTLEKIAGRLGRPICTDHQTAVKGRVSYPRILVDANVMKPLVENIKIVSPERERIDQEVYYEWLPHQCKQCRKWGHRDEDCNSKPRLIQKWVPKQKSEVKDVIGQMQENSVHRDMPGINKQTSMSKKKAEREGGSVELITGINEQGDQTEKPEV